MKRAGPHCNVGPRVSSFRLFTDIFCSVVSAAADADGPARRGKSRLSRATRQFECRVGVPCSRLANLRQQFRIIT